MNNIQQIVRLLSPAFRGSPVIIGIIVVMIFLATRIVQYSTPMYECTGRIKLEDANTDISNTNLFKTFDVFTQPGKIMAEVEVIKSPEILRASLHNIPFDVSYFRVGKIRTSELFYDSPFQVTYDVANDSYYGVAFYIQAIDKKTCHLSYTLQGKTKKTAAAFGKSVALPGINLTIKLNNTLLTNKPGVNLYDNYYFTINSEDQQIEELSKYIDVKELDKEIPVVRIICKHPVPEKAMLLTNTLMETYINEGIRIKTGAAKKTVDFIDNQLTDIANKLAESESEMENYRMKNHIMNTRLEVETDLKKVAQLKVQLTNVEMNLATLDTLDFYINQGDADFLDKAANYEGYGGLLYTEMMKRIKNLQSEKKELLLKYTPENEKVKVMDAKIADVVDYIKKNIHNARNSMQIQRDKIAKDIDLAELPFINIPTKEKNMIILEREFKLNQEIYNFLNEKRTEANIVQSATFSFHRIIQRATLPIDPVSPKKTFTILVFGFLGLLLSIALIYGYEAVSSRIKYKDQLEKNSSCPVVADIRHEKKAGQSMPDFLALATRLVINHKGNQIITITSGIDSEGKTFVAERLAQALAAMEINVLLVGTNLRDCTIGKLFSMKSEKGFSEYITLGLPLEECIHAAAQKGLKVMPEGKSKLIPEAIFIHPQLKDKLDSLQEKFQVIILDTPSFDTALDAIPLISMSDTTLYIFRANYSKTKMLMDPDLLQEEYGFTNIRLVLNDVEGFAKMKKDRGIRKSAQLLVRKTIYIAKKQWKKYRR